MQSIVSHSWPEACFYALQSRKDTVPAFAACESKSTLITIVSFSLSSNKLGNNFNCASNLLMPISSLLISNKKVLSCNWLATVNNFLGRKELKMWISGALFEQKRFSFDNLTYVVFWAKGELFNKNPLKGSVHISQFQNPRNRTDFSGFTQKQFQIHDKTKNRLNTLDSDC